MMNAHTYKVRRFAYQIRLDWFSAVIAESIYQDSPIPGREPEESGPEWKADLVLDAVELGWHQGFEGDDPTVPNFLADVPELANGWLAGHAAGQRCGE